MSRPAFVYMLRCADGSYYVGSTTDLEARLQQHNLGMGAEYTRRRLPVVLVWHEQLERIDHGFAREKQIQNWSRRKREALIAQRYDELPALAESHYWAQVRAAEERRGGGTT